MGEEGALPPASIDNAPLAQDTLGGRQRGEATGQEATGTPTDMTRETDLVICVGWLSHEACAPTSELVWGGEPPGPP